MKRLFILVCLLLITSAKAAKPVDTQVKRLMHIFDAQLGHLRTFLATEEKFKSKKGIDETTKVIKTLREETHKMQSDTISQTTGYRVTYKLLADHFEKTERLLQNGEYDYARLMINSMTGYCITCHTQIPEAKNKYDFIDAKTGVATSLNDAEFLFITRRFDRALKSFDWLIRNYPDSKLEAGDIPILYRRKLAIFARVKRDPNLAVASLAEDIKSKNIPTEVRNNIEIWIEYFKTWRDEKFDPLTLSDKDLISFVEKNMTGDGDRKIAPADPRAVAYLRLSGLLYERMVAQPNSPERATILYYLATCEKNIGSLYWYSLSDIYLFECLKYPKTAVAKKCLASYEQSVMARYKTEGAIPREVRDQLKSYREKL